MKRVTRLWVVVTIVGAFFIGVAGAQEHPKEHPNQDRSGSKSTGQIKGTLLMGIEVQHPKGNTLGYIEDAVLTPSRDRISYALLSSGGFMGVSDKRFAIPWSAFEFNASNNLLLLPVEQQTLKDTAGLSKDEWPEVGDARWAKIAAEYRGEKLETEKPSVASSETRAGSKGFTTRRLSKLIGTEVYNRNAEHLGEIENVVFASPLGSVEFAVISVDTPGVTVNPKYSAVPWGSLLIRPRLGTALLNAERQTLTALAFEDDAYPNLADPSMSQRIRSAFNVNPLGESVRAAATKDRVKDTGSDTPWCETGSEYNRNFNASTVTTIEGTVENVESFQPSADCSIGQRLTLVTDEGKYFLHIGPQYYLNENKMQYFYGDDLSITGSIVTIGKERVMMVCSIKRLSDGKELVLRDQSGNPRWKPRSAR